MMKVNGTINLARRLAVDTDRKPATSGAIFWDRAGTKLVRKLPSARGTG